MGTRTRRHAMGAAGLAAASLLLGLAWGSGRSVSPPSDLVLTPELLARLQTLADGLFNEIVLCLEGYVDGETAYAVDFSMPTPRESTPMRSSFDPCEPGTLASWHNHPTGKHPASLASVATRSATKDRARRLCVLSGTDISTAERLRYPFAVVAVDGGTWCWWTLEEVEAFAAEAISLGRPAPGRIAGAEPATSWSRPGETDPSGGR